MILNVRKQTDSTQLHQQLKNKSLKNLELGYMLTHQIVRNHIVNLDQPKVLASAKIWQRLNVLYSFVAQEKQTSLQSKHQLYASVNLCYFSIYCNARLLFSASVFAIGHQPVVHRIHAWLNNYPWCKQQFIEMPKMFALKASVDALLLNLLLAKTSKFHTVPMFTAFEGWRSKHASRQCLR